MRTVLDKITFITSTAFSGEFIIVGSALHAVMQLVIVDLIENPDMFDLEKLQFDSEETVYGNEFYLEIWQKSIRPIVEHWIKSNFPSAWFLKMYSSKLYLA